MPCRCWNISRVSTRNTGSSLGNCCPAEDGLVGQQSTGGATSRGSLGHGTMVPTMVSAGRKWSKQVMCLVRRCISQDLSRGPLMSYPKTSSQPILAQPRVWRNPETCGLCMSTLRRTASHSPTRYGGQLPCAPGYSDPTAENGTTKCRG
eukprot:s4926_g4.t1